MLKVISWMGGTLNYQKCSGKIRNTCIATSCLYDTYDEDEDEWEREEREEREAAYEEYAGDILNEYSEYYDDREDGQGWEYEIPSDLALPV